MKTQLPLINFKKPITLRISNGSAKGGMTFLVKIAEDAPISIRIIGPMKMKKILKAAASRFSRAPYSRFIKERLVNIWVVSENSFRKLYYPDRPKKEYSIYDVVEEIIDPPIMMAAIYNSLLDAVIINSSGINHGKSDQEVIVHELLHAFSSEVKETKERELEIRMGIYFERKDRATGEVLSSSGKLLNEGLTEFLRVNKDQSREYPNHEYYPLYKAISLLAQRVGEEILWDAYFNGNIPRLETAIDKIYGPEAYRYLLYLPVSLYERYCPERIEKDLKGFILYGFEYNVMEKFCYSPEDRKRAPRLISLDKLPSKIKNGLEGKNIKIYTNLTDEELVLFSRNVDSYEGTSVKYCCISSRELEDFFVNLKQTYQEVPCLEIIKLPTRKDAIVSLETFDPKHLNFPNFLGRRPISSSHLFDVSLEEPRQS